MVAFVFLERGLAEIMQINYYPSNGVNTYTGYGKMELGVARGLQAAGVTLNIAPVEGVPTLVCGNAGWLEAPHVRGHRLWLMTMSEADRISDDWVWLINHTAERVLVPAPGLVQIYRDSGVDVPVHYVGLGVDDFEKPAPNPHPLTPSPQSNEGEQDVFTLLTYSYGDMRKGADLAMLAFNRLFKDDARYRMVVKAREGHDKTWLAGLEDEQITVIGGATDEAAWRNLLLSADCFVFPSRGEGFGLPPREAALMGLPVIATEWLGMWDVAQWGLPIRVKDMRPSRFDKWEANAEGSRWSEPDDGHLQMQMKWVVEHPAEARAIARRGREYLLKTANWDVVAGRIVSLLVEHEQRDREHVQTLTKVLGVKA